MQLNEITVNAQSFVTLPYYARQELLDQLSDHQWSGLKYDWPFWARPEQIQPENLGNNGKFIWAVKAGRGWGKTRVLAEWCRDKVNSGQYKYISLVGSAADEVRNIMIEGESGIMACSPPWNMPLYEPSKKRLTWPNGAIANIFYGSEPDKSRGAQSDLVWMDEIAKWQYPEDTFDNILFGARLGTNPLVGVSSTPRPTKFMRELLGRDDCVVTTGNTYDNMANLAKPFINTILKKYKGTRLGLQEIYAKLLDDNPYALFQRSWIDRDRVSKFPDCYKIIVGIDPQASEDAEGAETGIIVAGVSRIGKDDHYFVLDDLSISGSPGTWAKQAMSGNSKYHGDGYVPEKNNGGDMVKSTLRNADKKNKIHMVWASRGKVTRAEPISLLSEQGYIHHVGNFAGLEDELCEWVPGEPSPNKLDAYVWALSWLSGNNMSSVKPPTGRVMKGRTKTRSQVARGLPE